MPKSLTEIEKKFAEMKLRFTEIESLNRFLSQQAKDYFLQSDSIRKLNSASGVKSLYKRLDNIFHKNFNIDEYALILKNNNSDILTIHHSMGLSKRDLKEIFYRSSKGLVGKVFSNARAVYIPDIADLKVFTYYFQARNLQGSIYYLPILDNNKICIGVLKMRKLFIDGFSELERSVFLNLQRDIGESILKAQKIDLLASKCYIDELTNLHNKNYFKEHFKIEFKRAQRYQHDLSLVLINIDNLKKINIDYNQAVGDLVLRNMAIFLNKFTRNSDICIRYGKYEFMIILPETSKKAACEVAKKLKNKIHENPNNYAGKLANSNIDLSIGITSYPQDTIEPKQLIDLVNQALENAKSLGKNQIGLAENIKTE